MTEGEVKHSEEHGDVAADSDFDLESKCMRLQLGEVLEEDKSDSVVGSLEGEPIRFFFGNCTRRVRLCNHCDRSSALRTFSMVHTLPS